MVNTQELISIFVLLFAVVDPIGSVPVFIAVTRQHQEWEKRKIAFKAVLVATGVLLFFIVVGQLLLEAIGVSLPAFQVAGGIVLFLFALTMIFGEGKPEQEIEVIKSGRETAIFPLAVPSIASPGAIMAVVVLTDNHRFSVLHQFMTGLVLLTVLLIVLMMLLSARWLHQCIGDGGTGRVADPVLPRHR